MAPDYEYIVVGSGPGGGPLAVKLALAGKRVLLLEAGDDQSENVNSNVPAFHARSTEDTLLAWKYFVAHYSTNETRDSKFSEKHRGIFYPRAKTLGGCAAHNAMIFVCPHDSDWNEIASEIGDHSWRAEEMWEHFKRIENCRYGPGTRLRRLLSAITLNLLGNPSGHGYNGWLYTETVSPLLIAKDRQLLSAVYEAVEAELRSSSSSSLLQRLFRATIRFLGTGFDPNDRRRVAGRREGVAITPMTTRNGVRYGPREFIRENIPLCDGKLEVRSNAFVTRLVFDKTDPVTVVGVEYQEKGSSGLTEVSAGEVILSAGAFSTPAILMHSGIGSRAHLDNLGINVRVDLEGVGKNLQDRYEVGVVSKLKKPFSLLAEATFGADAHDPHFQEWQNNRSGLYTSNGVAIGIIKKSRADLIDPDLYIFGLPSYFRGYQEGYSVDHLNVPQYFTWAILKGDTNNRCGEVLLRSNDPLLPPSVNFHYFDDVPVSHRWKDDLRALETGVAFARQINLSLADRGVIENEEIPGKAMEGERLAAFIKDEAWGHHASCSCKMGRKDDPLAVVDSEFRVYKTRNLRVVDASIFPRIPGLFIVSAVYLVGEKAAALILAGK